jgi:GGDEF domain-containing protein
MYGMNKADSLRRLQEFLRLLHQEKFIAPDGTVFQMSFSIGIAEYAQDGLDLQSLYQAADEILVQAKSK